MTNDYLKAEQIYPLRYVPRVRIYWFLNFSDKYQRYISRNDRFQWKKMQKTRSQTIELFIPTYKETFNYQHKTLAKIYCELPILMEHIHNFQCENMKLKRSKIGDIEENKKAKLTPQEDKREKFFYYSQNRILKAHTLKKVKNVEWDTTWWNVKTKIL